MIARFTVATQYTPSVLFPTVTQSKRMRTSHPSGSRRWGCSTGSRHPAPGSWEPQKILGALPCPSAVEAPFSAPPDRRDRERPSCRAATAWGLPFTVLWLACIARLQPLSGSRQRRIHRTFRLTTSYGWMRRRPNQFWWLSTNPLSSSPPQPNRYPFTRMIGALRRAPDHAGCNSRPGPVCGRPSRSPPRRACAPACADSSA